MTTRTGERHTPTSSSNRPVPQRGEVWLAILDKQRPIIILARNPMGRYLNALLTVPVTRTLRGGRNEVPLGWTIGCAMTVWRTSTNLRLYDSTSWSIAWVLFAARTLVALCDALAFTVAS